MQATVLGPLSFTHVAKEKPRKQRGNANMAFFNLLISGGKTQQYPTRHGSRVSQSGSERAGTGHRAECQALVKSHIGVSLSTLSLFWAVKG